MRTTEHSAKTPSATTGLFATLAGLLRAEGTGARSPRRLALASLLSTAALLALALPAAASAAEPLAHIGEIEGPEAGVPFQAFNSEAIAPNDHNGHIYVADSGAHRVYDFESAADTSPEVWDGTTTPAGEWTGALALAVDNSSGDVYVADSSHAVIEKFDQSGNLIASFGDTENEITHTPEPNGQLAGLATPATSFSPAASTSFGIAVDQKTGDLYAIDAGHEVIDAFSSSGAYLSQIAAPPGSELFGAGGAYTDGIAVNGSSRQLLVSDSQDLKIYRFDLASGAFVKPALDGHDTPAGSFGTGFTSVAASNANGSILAADTANGVVDQFECSGGYTAQIQGAGQPHAIAVDQASGEIYLADRGTGAVQVYEGTPTTPCALTEPATAVEATAATVHGAVNPNGAALSACKFEYVTDAAYQENLAHTAGHDGFSELSSGGEATCAPAAGSIAADSELHGVEADPTGLQPGTTYHFRLVAAAAGGTGLGNDETLETPPDPLIDAAAATEVSATSAKLIAAVDPRGFETTCQIQWGATAEPGNPSVPYEHTEDCNPFELGEGNTDVPVSLQLEELAKGATYHWRVLATNVNGTAQSFEHTFAFLGSPPHETCPANEAFRTGDSANLPDCRAYEQVTPTVKNGSLIGDVFLGLGPDFAADGSRLVLSSVQCFGGSTSCPVNRGNVGTSFAFARGAGGWETTPLSPPATQFDASSIWTVGADTGAALYSTPTPPHGEDDIYLRRPDGTFADVGPATPPAEGPQGPIGFYGPRAATADLSHYVYGIDTEFLKWPFDATQGGFYTLYEYAGTGNEHPLLVGVSGGFESHDLISTCSTTLGTGNIGVVYPGDLSADGRTVYFTARGGPGCLGSGANEGTEVPADTLYARIDGEIAGKARTVEISGRSATDCSGPCATSTPAAAWFDGASEDGTRAYFSSTQQLTNEASEDSHPGDSAARGHQGCSETTGQGGCNLYLYDFHRPEGERLLDASAGDSSGKGPRVQGVMAISADGSHAYFVAKGVLAANPGAATDPATGQPQQARAGAENLYVYDAGSGQTSFIATLPAADDHPIGEAASFEWSEGPMEANVTPDGRFLVFPSKAALTPDTAPTGVQQVYRYDAQSGRLNRVSIGQRGFNDNGNSPASPACSTDQTIGCPDAAAIARTSAFFSFAGSPRRNPTMSDDGSHVFFTSPLGLTPGALNDVQISTDEHGNPKYAQNVYEWEPDGAEVDGRLTCEEAEGCVRLVSDGRDASEAPSATCGLASAVCLIGAGASGNDVFFTTTDRLAPSDTDTQVDYYDARVNGGFPTAAGVTPCQGDACPGPGTEAGAEQAPATPTFSGKPEGPKHQVKPRKHHRKKNGKKHRKSHKHHAKRASTTGRAGK